MQPHRGRRGTDEREVVRRHTAIRNGWRGRIRILHRPESAIGDAGDAGIGREQLVAIDGFGGSGSNQPRCDIADRRARGARQRHAVPRGTVILYRASGQRADLRLNARQLCDVDRVGCGGAGRDVGDLAFTADGADGHFARRILERGEPDRRVSRLWPARGHAVGTERGTVRAGDGCPRAQRNRADRARTDAGIGAERNRAQRGRVGHRRIAERDRVRLACKRRRPGRAEPGDPVAADRDACGCAQREAIRLRITPIPRADDRPVGVKHLQRDRVARRRVSQQSGCVDVERRHQRYDGTDHAQNRVHRALDRRDDPRDHRRQDIGDDRAWQTHPRASADDIGGGRGLCRCRLRHEQRGRGETNQRGAVPQATQYTHAALRSALDRCRIDPSQSTADRGANKRTNKSVRHQTTLHWRLQQQRGLSQIVGRFRLNQRNRRILISRVLTVSYRAKLELLRNHAIIETLLPIIIIRSDYKSNPLLF